MDSTIEGPWNGYLPTQIGWLTNLTLISLHSNMYGVLPTQIGQLSSLVSLRITSNSISGTIPTQIGQILYLRKFSLESSSISGTIPTQFGKLISLSNLNIHNTDISGTLPSELNNLKSLRSIDISNTLLCSSSFPSAWNTIDWVSCNLNIPHNCDLDVPKGCSTSDCDETTQCFVNQCTSGTDKCTNGRNCVFKPDIWGYNCTSCNDYLFFTAGLYTCKPSYVIIISQIVAVLLVFIIIFIISLKKKKILRTQDLFQDDGILSYYVD